MAQQSTPSTLLGTYRSATSVARGDGKGSFEVFTEYTFNADGAYEMTGYPVVSEKGKFTVVEKVGNDWRVKLSNRVQKSSKKVTNEDGEVIKETNSEWSPAEVTSNMRVGSDSITWDNKLYRFVTKARPSEEKPKADE